MIRQEGFREISLHQVIIRPEGYPVPVPVQESATWDSVDRTTYKPQDYTSQSVFDHDMTKDPSDPKMWADPADPREVDHPYESYEGDVKFDERGRPLNPIGPIGIEGRGKLGKWGRNRAVDPVVTRISKEGRLQLIVITRSDSGAKALPGGMLDRGEDVKDALERELAEETLARVTFENADLVYQGYVNSNRNTDNAWIETDAYHVHLEDGEVDVVGGDDAVDAAWMTVDSTLLNSLHDNHGKIVQKAVDQWQLKTKKIVDNQGQVISSE